MKIEVDRNVTMEDVEAALQHEFTERTVKIKREKDQLNVSVNSIQGAVIRLRRADTMTRMEVLPQMPIQGTLTIVSVIVASIIYQTCGHIYGIRCGHICGLPAIFFAVGWPLLLSRIVSRSIATECVAILSKTFQA